MASMKWKWIWWRVKVNIALPTSLLDNASEHTKGLLFKQFHAPTYDIASHWKWKTVSIFRTETGNDICV